MENQINDDDQFASKRISRPRTRSRLKRSSCPFDKFFARHNGGTVQTTTGWPTPSRRWISAESSIYIVLVRWFPYSATGVRSMISVRLARLKRGANEYQTNHKEEEKEVGREFVFPAGGDWKFIRSIALARTPVQFHL